MKRRLFIKKSFVALSALPMLNLGCTRNHEPIRHVLSLGFDDGFKKSSYKTAEIHANYGLQACLNVIATGHLKSFTREPKWIPQHLLGDFDDWNRLQSEGHIIMPHTWEHLNLTEVPLSLAKENIHKCLEYFEENLDGYTNTKGVYNFAYNASTPELEKYTLTKVHALRTGGWLFLEGKTNPIPTDDTPRVVGCFGKGPDNCDDFIEKEINEFLESDGGWLILNLHGLDEEGWGPISSSYLDKLLARISKIDWLKISPISEVLKSVHPS